MARNALGLFFKVFAGDAPSSERKEFGSNPAGDVSDDFEQGWTAEYSNPASGLYPRRTEYNDLFAKLTAVAVDINKYGVLPWDTNPVYEAGAYVVGTDGVLYKATVQNQAVDPVSESPPDKWEKFVGGLKTSYSLTPPAGGDLRTFDATNYSMQDIADVLATVIKDLT